MKQVRGLFASLFVLTFAILGPSPAATADAPAGRSEAPAGEMIWGAHISLAPTWFDPAETSGIITPFMVIYALHDSMLKPMPGNPMAPSLAESWSMSPDGLVYEFVLRKGVKFHNGDTVTSEDVKFSLERYRGAANKALKESVTAIETPDPGRVRIRPVQVRLVHPGRRAGAGSLRPVLAQDAEREADRPAIDPRRHDTPGSAQ